MENYEKAIIVEAIAAEAGDKQAASKRLGIGKSSLYAKIEKYGLS